MLKKRCPYCSDKLSFWSFLFKGIDKIIEQKPYKCPSCKHILFQDTGIILLISITLGILPFIFASLFDNYMDTFNILEHISFFVGYFLLLVFFLWMFILN